MKSRFPFTSFPSGWFFVAYSHKLSPGQVKPLHYFGKDLVLFRTEDGTACVLDAHCPHLGAHLGYGGKVQGETIQCPFHGWCFDTNGYCAKIPYGNKIPPKAQMRTWSVREVNGWIMVYHHNQGHGEFSDWKIPELPEYNSQEWISFQPVRNWKLRTHIRELAENGMDVAHLPFLHSQIIADLKSDGQETNDSTHIHYLSAKYRLPPVVSFFGKEVDGALEITSHGLGCQISRVRVKSWIEMRILIVFLLTPIDEEYLDVHLVVSVKEIFNKPITRAIAAIYGKEAVRSLSQDIPILENKVYLNNPLLCDSEKPLVEYRRWASQFLLAIPEEIKIPVQH
jgi:phenylpropionate dioxygenase-like ring-hydroxylating dioxygenase large terminal subunit